MGEVAGPFAGLETADLPEESHSDVLAHSGHIVVGGVVIDGTGLGGASGLTTVVVRHRSEDHNHDHCCICKFPVEPRVSKMM